MSGIITDNVGRSSGLVKAVEAAGGGVLQVKQAVKNDTESFAGSLTREDIADLTLAITPASASNEILVSFAVVGSSANDMTFQIECDSSGSYEIISPPDASSNRTLTHCGNTSRHISELDTSNMTILDAPAIATEINYKVTTNNGPSGGGTAYVNRSPNEPSDNANEERGISTLTIMEIASSVLT